MLPFKDKQNRVIYAESVRTTLREGHCLPAYPGKDSECLNLPEHIRADWEQDLRETRTTKIVCDKAEAPQSERSEIR